MIRLLLPSTVLLAVAGISAAEFSRGQDDNLRRTNRVLRASKSDSNSQGGDDDGSLLEDHPCMEFGALATEVTTNSLTDAECATNSCDGGCCRFFFDYLTCDEENDFPQLPVGINYCETNDLEASMCILGSRRTKHVLFCLACYYIGTVYLQR